MSELHRRHDNSRSRQQGDRFSQTVLQRTHSRSRTHASAANASKSGAECQQESNFLALISTELNVSEEMTNRQICSELCPIKTNSRPRLSRQRLGLLKLSTARGRVGQAALMHRRSPRCVLVCSRGRNQFSGVGWHLSWCPLSVRII